MSTIKRYLSVVFLLSIALSALTGCDQPSDETQKEAKDAKPSAPSPLPTSAAKPIANPEAPKQPASPADPLGPRYVATLAEGIDFTKPGYPSFIASVEGMSVYEATHRWTDSSINKTAKFTLIQTLPEKFTLEITTGSWGPNAGKNLLVRVGNIEKSVTLSADGAVKSYKIDFNGVKSANTIELIAPEPISPAEFTHGKSTETRIIALSLISIKILTAP